VCGGDDPREEDVWCRLGEIWKRKGQSVREESRENVMNGGK